MARILVAYATRHGSTAGIPGAVTRGFAVAGLEVEVAVLSTVDSFGGYDWFVLRAPFYTGRPLDLAPFVVRHRDVLFRIPIVALAVGLTPAAPEPKPAQAEQARKALIDALSLVGRSLRFSSWGAVDPEKMVFPDRAMTNLLQAQGGDIRDWDVVEGWTRTLLPLLSGVAGTH